MSTPKKTPSCREQSKAEWNASDTNQDINTGSFQRIADACEKMAVNFQQIYEKLEAAKNGLENYRYLWLEEQRRSQYLKSANTKLKNKLKAIEQKGLKNG